MGNQVTLLGLLIASLVGGHLWGHLCATNSSGQYIHPRTKVLYSFQFFPYKLPSLFIPFFLMSHLSLHILSSIMAQLVRVLYKTPSRILYDYNDY